MSNPVKYNESYHQFMCELFEHFPVGRIKIIKSILVDGLRSQTDRQEDDYRLSTRPAICLVYVNSEGKKIALREEIALEDIPSGSPLLTYLTKSEYQA